MKVVELCFFITFRWLHPLEKVHHNMRYLKGSLFLEVLQVLQYHSHSMMCKSSNFKVQVKSKSAWLCMKSGQVKSKSDLSKNWPSSFSIKIGVKSIQVKSKIWTCTSLLTLISSQGDITDWFWICVQIYSSWLASSFIMFITKPPTELLKSELSVTFGSGSHFLIWSE